MKMDTMTMFLGSAMMVMICGCMGMNTVRVCHIDSDMKSCVIGWYDDDGCLIIMVYGFSENSDIEIISSQGYEEHAIGTRIPVYTRANVSRAPAYPLDDVVSYTSTQKFPQSLCYREATVGDWVTISTYHYPMRARIIRKTLDSYALDRSLRPGDCGAPVTRRGCIVGMARPSHLSPSRVLALRQTKGK